MTTTLANPVNIAVEGSARVLRGQLVPYGIPTLVGDRDVHGKLVIYRERWDANSLEIPSTMVPLLASHDESRPVGKVIRLWHDDRGLQLEAELIGSSSEVDGLRERIGHGIMSGLSIGFYGDASADLWESAGSTGDTPMVTRRGARLREASLVVWPAFKDAQVLAVRNRTELQLASDEILGEYRERKAAERAEARAFLAEYTARKDALHEASEQLKAQYARPSRSTR